MFNCIHYIYMIAIKRRKCTVGAAGAMVFFSGTETAADRDKAKET